MPKHTLPSIGQYLLDRLYAHGVRHIFGVPGDYVLRFDKLIEQHPDIQFVNTTRENPAGYAADAYARLRGLGVACITYGVGINIANSLAQAYVESSPLVVISGSAGVQEYQKHSVLHHLINKSIHAHGDRTQLEIFKNLTIDQGILDDPSTAAEIIDRVLNASLQQKKPVYLEIPRDLVDQPLPSIPVSAPFQLPSSDKEALKEALKETEELFAKSRHPVIWAGHEILRYGLSRDLLDFAEAHQIPIVSSLLGKTVVDEHHPLFAGVYQGEMSSQRVLDLIHECDCLLIAGAIMDDLGTGIFTNKTDQEHRLFANRDHLTIGCHHYEKIHLVDYVKGLMGLSLPQYSASRHISRHSIKFNAFKVIPNARTTTQRVFECIQSHLTENDIVVSDVGDCLFASSDLVLNQNSFISCAYFASLGFGIPGAIGAQIADPKRRVIAIVGDGGFQMTATELSTALRYHLDPIVIVLNNQGYGTERILLDGSYNDIVNWNYWEIPRFLGGGVGIKAETETEFDGALNKAIAHRGEFYLIEVELEKMDFSPALHRLGALLGKIIKS